MENPSAEDSLLLVYIADLPGEKHRLNKAGGESTNRRCVDMAAFEFSHFSLLYYIYFSPPYILYPAVVFFGIKGNTSVLYYLHALYVKKGILRSR